MRRVKRGVAAGAMHASGRPLARFAEERVCAEPACLTRLSCYNGAKTCFLHTELVPTKSAR
jgi:hypothetical protein